jgi:hypothetical protein
MTNPTRTILWTATRPTLRIAPPAAAVILFRAARTYWPHLWIDHTGTVRT